MAAGNASDNLKINPMPLPNADFTTTWAYLEKGIDQAMSGGITSYHTFMSLTAVVFNYCTSGTSSEPPRGFAPRSSALYENLLRYFDNHLKPLQTTSDSLHDEALLQYYAAEWDRYTAGAHSVHRLFSHLNNLWIKRERDEGRKSIYPLYELALRRWKSDVFLYVQSKNQKLSGAILQLIERERNGETIDRGLVKKVVDSFVSLGLDGSDINKISYEVYHEHLEVPFLDATETYYRRISEKFLAEHSAADYRKKAEEWLREEEDRVEKYMDTSTRDSLIQKCKDVLFDGHAELIGEGTRGAAAAEADHVSDHGP